MKRFLMFSVSVLCLAVAALIGFYIGSFRVEAQTPSDTVFFYDKETNHQFIAILPNGDIYRNVSVGGPLQYAPCAYVGNFWNGAVSTDKPSWGEIKGQFNGEK